MDIICKRVTKEVLKNSLALLAYSYFFQYIYQFNDNSDTKWYHMFPSFGSYGKNIVFLSRIFILLLHRNSIWTCRNRRIHFHQLNLQYNINQIIIFELYCFIFLHMAYYCLAYITMLAYLFRWHQSHSEIVRNRLTFSNTMGSIGL